MAARVAVGDRTDIEFIHVVDRDRKHVGLERAVGRGGPDGDRSSGSVRFAVDRPGDRNDARTRIDRKPATVVVVQRVGDRVGGVRVVRKSGHTDRRPDGGVFADRIGGRVIVDNRCGAEFRYVGDVDRKVLSAERSIAAGRPHDHVVAGIGFVIESRIDRDLTG